MIKNNNIFSKRIVIYFIVMTILVNIYSYFKPKTIIYENKELEERFVSKFYENMKKIYIGNFVITDIEKVDGIKNVFKISFLERNTNLVDKIFVNIEFKYLNTGIQYEIKNIKILALNTSNFKNKNDVLKLSIGNEEERTILKFYNNVSNINIEKDKVLVKIVKNNNDEIISNLLLILILGYAISSIIFVMRDKKLENN